MSSTEQLDGCNRVFPMLLVIQVQLWSGNYFLFQVALV